VIAQEHMEKRTQRVGRLRDVMVAKLLQIEDIVCNGPSEHRVANNINISIPGIDSEFAVVSLDEAGIACSTKSACSGAGGQGSAVVRTISNDEARATSTIRFSLGEETTSRDIDKAVMVLEEHVEKMRITTQKLTRN